MRFPRTRALRLSASSLVLACLIDPALAQTAPSSTVELDAIDVQGAPATGSTIKGYVAKQSTTATKSDTPLIETSQSISVITQDQIRQQDSQNLDQALAYTSGVTHENRGAVATRFDLIKVRGFDAVTYLNGLRLFRLDFASPQVDPFLLDRIEVLKGPASVLYGQSPAGGLVNLVTKMPLSTSYREIGIEYGNYGHQQYTFDLTGPANPEGTVLYRIAGVGRADTGQQFRTYSERFAIAPSVTWQPDGDSSLTLTGLYQHDPAANTYAGVPAVGSALPNRFGKLGPSTNVGEPDLETFDRTEGSLGYAFRHRFDDHFVLRMNGQWFNNDVDYGAVYGTSLSRNQRTLSRSYSINHDALTSFAFDNQLESKFDTGPLQHTVVTGFDTQHYDGAYRSGTGPAPSLDLFAPIYGRPVTSPLLRRTVADGTQYGLYAQDEIKFGGFVATLAGRSDWAESLTKTTTLRTPQDDQAFTGRWGLLYLFDNGVAPYVTYAQSFTPQPGASFQGTAFSPERGELYEGGVKYQPVGLNALFTAAAFDLDRTNLVTTDPLHQAYSIQVGAARSRGVELEARVSVEPGLDLVAAYTHLDVRYTRDNSGLQGKVPVGVPSDEGSIWAHYAFEDGPAIGLALGAGVRYLGSNFNTDNTIKLPGVALIDAAMSYDLGRLTPSVKGAELTANARNLLDKTYVASCYTSAICGYGFGRTVMAGLRYTW